MRPAASDDPALEARSSGKWVLDGITIPVDRNETVLDFTGRKVKLTNLRKPFWPELGITKGDLLRYYLQISPALLPHIADVAVVMKRYPNGAAGRFFFQKRAPVYRPDWIKVCPIEHASGSIIDFLVVRNLPSLLWVVNLGCIDLNPWYARCDDIEHPDYLHFDLDPVPPAEFGTVLEAAKIMHKALDGLKMPNFVKTTGSKGVHIYIPIFRGPTQKEVWSFAKEMAKTMEELYPKIITAEYRIEKRPGGRVLVDYNQNAWGRTLASVYSVRARPEPSVSAPVTWAEVKKGIRIEQFRLDNMPDRVRRRGDLWHGLLAEEDRFDLNSVMTGQKGRR
jgi:bifunctional non-homologous end joining protein LigD